MFVPIKERHISLCHMKVLCCTGMNRALRSESPIDRHIPIRTETARDTIRYVPDTLLDCDVAIGGIQVEKSIRKITFRN